MTIDDFVNEDNYYLVEEYIEGTSINRLTNRFNLLLKRTLEEKTNFNKEVNHIIRTMFQNLSNIHEEGILLEDISISNMILTPENEIYFIDFETAYQKSSGKLMKTTNNFCPQTITAKYEDSERIKLWYAIIDMLTNTASLLQFDRTCFSTIKSFIKMSSEMGLPDSMITRLIADFEKEKQFDILSLFPASLGIDFEKLNNLREQLLETLIVQNTIPIQSESILDEIDNYHAIKKIGLKPSEELNRDEILKRATDGFEYLIAEFKLQPKHSHLNFYSLIELANSQDLAYKDKYRILQVLNEHPNNHSETFKSIIDSIRNNDIELDQGIPYVKTGDFLSPYLVSGNSGLIIELIKFSLKENISEYDEGGQKVPISHHIVCFSP